MFGGKSNSIKRSKRMQYLDEAYLDRRLSKREAERRAWKALSYLSTNDYVRK
jgi:hypothetical protein